MFKRMSGLFAVLVIAALVLGACAPAATATPTQPAAAPTTAPAEPTAAPSEPTTAPAAEPTAPATEPTVPAASGAELPDVDPAALEGDIVAAGSSTVFPLAQRVAEDFKADGFPGDINIASVGTGGGFERFCAGETDIANASRAIKDSETEACQANGRTPIPFLVGLDAIAVVVSAENDFVEDLTIDELSQIMAGEVTTWNEVNADWPAEPIQRFTPGTDSGTFDFFVETVIQKPRDLEDLDAAEAIALAVTENLQTSEDDNVLVQGVEGSPYAIGYFGYAYFQSQGEKLRAVSIDGVTPSLETAENGDYVLSRPLYLYSDATVLQEKPQVAGFINYFLTFVGDVIEEVGYFPASHERMAESVQNFLGATQ